MSKALIDLMNDIVECDEVTEHMRSLQFEDRPPSICS